MVKVALGMVFFAVFKIHSRPQELHVCANSSRLNDCRSQLVRRYCLFACHQEFVLNSPSHYPR